MSRCFPFPPPGYEKRARADDANLLTKEKHKEKKHKRDKKDKEKREGKEKKDKERSKDKHKEKKDRKEKHKEKKDKDRDKDKDKTLTSAEKKAEKQPERSNGENAGLDGQKNVETKDSKHVQELSRRIRDEDGATGSQTVQNAVTDSKRATLLDRVVAGNITNRFKEEEKIKDEKTINGFRNHVDPRVLENEVVRKSSGDGKAKVVDPRVLDNEVRKSSGDGKAKAVDLRVLENEVRKSSGDGKAKAVDPRVLENEFIRKSSSDGKAKVGDPRVLENEAVRKSAGDGKTKAVDPRVLENEVVRKSSGDGKAKAVDQNNVEKKIEAKEKSEKHKNRDKEKRSKSKDKDRNREKEKKEKVKKTEQGKEQPKLKEGTSLTGISFVKPLNHLLKGDTKVEMKKEPTIEQPELKENGKLSPHAFIFEPSSRLKEDTKNSSVDGILGKRKELEVKKEPAFKDISKVVPVINNVKLSNHVKEDTRSSNGVGNLGKRKEPEMNGILNDNGVLRPGKSSRLVSPIHPVVENGRKTEPCQIPEQVKPEKQVAANNLKVEIKGHRVNGMSDAQAPKRSTHASANVQVNENGELCGKPPHPDSKYLNQILSLPKIEELLDHDNQDWLFSCNKPKKPKVASPEDRTSQVWAQGLKIESADIYALPYVIPY